MFEDFWEKFGAQFETLPERLGGHIGLSLAALLVGILISIPLGIFISNRPKAESFFMTLASIIQTIPSLALLALMVFAFGSIGWIPAWLALILYSLLPMLRNTVTGIQGVDASYIEAARGIGMDASQMLFRVKLPLALPTIVSGIRTASVWVVGAATLAQPVEGPQSTTITPKASAPQKDEAHPEGCACRSSGGRGRPSAHLPLMDTSSMSNTSMPAGAPGRVGLSP